MVMLMMILVSTRDVQELNQLKNQMQTLQQQLKKAKDEGGDVLALKASVSRLERSLREAEKKEQDWAKQKVVLE